MYDFLKDLTIVEGASFIAGPSCALHLHQFGAKVIRFDAIGGGPDYRRWPLSQGGESLYWEGLNKGKLSVALDLSRPEGRELAVEIITAPGEGRGLFVTNYPKKGFLSHEALAQKRADLITLRVQGWADGRNGVDYTVNAAVGVPYMTGDPVQNGNSPVNATLPAWDLLAGAYGAFTVLSAERQRRMTGLGGEYMLALSDLAIGSLAHMGQLAEAQLHGERARIGNALYGAFGRNFTSKDGRDVMIVAITPKQWKGLLEGLSLSQELADLERQLGVDFATDEGQRYIHRAKIEPLVAARCQQMSYDALTQVLEKGGVCWEPYQTLSQALHDDPRLVRDNPIFSTITQASGLETPVPGALARAEGVVRRTATAAPKLGAHTEEVLAQDLGLSSGQIAALVDQKIVALG